MAECDYHLAWFADICTGVGVEPAGELQLAWERMQRANHDEEVAMANWKQHDYRCQLADHEWFHALMAAKWRLAS